MTESVDGDPAGRQTRGRGNLGELRAAVQVEKWPGQDGKGIGIGGEVHIAVGQEEHPQFQTQRLTVIKPVSQSEATAGALLVVNMPAEKDRRSRRSQDPARANRTGGYEWRHMTILDPPEQILAAEIEAVRFAAGIAADRVASAAVA